MLALRSDGTVVAWGENNYGQATVPPGLADVAAISAGGFHNVVMRDERVPPSLTAATPPSSGTVGVAYPGYTFTATGDPAPTFAVSSGALPPGLTLSSGGSLTGTPTAAGSWTFRVSATNGKAPAAVTPPIDLTIAPAPTPPVTTPPVTTPPVTTPPVSGPPTGPPTSTSFTPPATPPAGDGVLKVASATGSLISTARPGAQLTLTGTGFAPGSAVTFVVYSTPQVLGTGTADPSGAAVLAVTLPTDLEPGRHTLVAYGTAAGGGPRALTAGFTLTHASATPATLASTGTDIAVPLWTGLTFLTVGGLALIGARGRGRRSGQAPRPGS